MHIAIESDNFMEGINDMTHIKSINTSFNEILDVIRTQYTPYIIEWTDTDIQIDGERMNDYLPTVWFGVADSIESKVNGYNPDINMIRIDITKYKDEFATLMQHNDYDGVSKMLMRTRDVFMHEMRHCIDKSNAGNHRAFLHNYKHERLDRLTNIFAQLTECLTDIDVDYYNTQTEINAYIMQHIWLSIDNIITHRKETTFNQFVADIMNSDFYHHLMVTAKKRVIKRMYYVWDAIYRQLPSIESLDADSYNGLKNMFATKSPSIKIRCNLNPAMESLSSRAADIVSGADIDLLPSMRKRWFIGPKSDRTQLLAKFW